MIDDEAGPAKKVFIGYAHFDGEEEYRTRVYSLSEVLRQRGIDCEIDQYVEDSPPRSWPAWMTDQIAEADYVLVVCAPTYKRRFEDRETPGVGRGSRWEGGAITSAIYNEQGKEHKFIPIGFINHALAEANIPYPLDLTTYYDVSTDEGRTNVQRRVRSEPRVTKSPLGTPPLLNRPEHRVVLDDTISRATKAFKKQREELGFQIGAPHFTFEEYKRRVEGYEDVAVSLIGSLIPIAKYSKGEELSYLRKAVEQITGRKQPDGARYPQWDWLWEYSTTFLIYSLGSVAIESENYAALRMLLLEPKSSEPYSQKSHRIIDTTYGAYTLQFDYSQGLPGVPDRARNPGSYHLGHRVERLLSALYDTCLFARPTERRRSPARPMRRGHPGTRTAPTLPRTG